MRCMQERILSTRLLVSTYWWLIAITATSALHPHSHHYPNVHDDNIFSCSSTSAGCSSNGVASYVIAIPVARHFRPQRRFQGRCCCLFSSSSNGPHPSFSSPALSSATVANRPLNFGSRLAYFNFGSPYSVSYTHLTLPTKA